ncbi:unannotated protein [freshwater metagenome]|uniref:Unannotated protein n=1 Tax=freshwater metagenome TaxID=449393 RepID=A0A6J7F242_9ZZZZ
MPVTSTTATSETNTAVRRRPARCAHGGSGVVRKRLRTPACLEYATPRASETNDAMQTPNTANTGVRNWATRTPERSSITSLPAIAQMTTRNDVGKISVKKAAIGVRQ